MKIIKVGTFDNEGMGTGWNIDFIGVNKSVYPILDLKPNGDVLIGGVLMVEMTEERKTLMGRR